MPSIDCRRSIAGDGSQTLKGCRPSVGEHAFLTAFLVTSTLSLEDSTSGEDADRYLLLLTRVESTPDI
eukprot:3662926-Amphidinium_carterae.2